MMYTNSEIPSLVPLNSINGDEDEEEKKPLEPSMNFFEKLLASLSMPDFSLWQPQPGGPAEPITSAAPATASTPAAPAAPAKKPSTPAVKETFVDIKPATSGMENKIYYSTDNFKTKHFIGVDSSGATVKIKTKPGGKLRFAIENSQGFFKQGAAHLNGDHSSHAHTKKTAAGTMIGFEDMRGGGDKDFDDAVILVRQVSR